MENLKFAFKELYQCVFTAEQEVKIGNSTVMPQEPIVVFDNIQTLGLQEIKKRADALGGYGNQAWVSWESSEKVIIDFTQGVFSKVHLALLGNGMIEKQNVEVPMWEILEADGDKTVTLKHKPILPNMWAYDAGNGKTLKGTVQENKITFKDIEPYTMVQVSYHYKYDKADTIVIGRPLLQNYLKMTAKVRLKDDITGKVTTGIISIPKLKLMSDFSMKMGDKAPPMCGSFRVIAFPVGDHGQQKVAELILLGEDADQDL